MIELCNLTKRFGDHIAVDNLNLRIETGEFFGLLGPNGAGKTTTISMISTVLLPSDGKILIDGEELTRRNLAQKRRLSVITQEYSMRQDMTMDEVMEYQGRLYYMPRKLVRQKTEELLEFTGLLEYRHKIVRHLSGGMKRKLMICRALMVEPEILLDDENLFHINNLKEVLLAVVNELYDANTNVVVACAVLGVKFRYNTSPRSILKH